ncbi:MAG TPA: hypothetical protein VL325_00395, partial [Pyrinomonadaceae bacterium]|nr:hypothetical protein [Pyrinomonadaceae bacterium]
LSAYSQNAEKLDEFQNPQCDDYLARMDLAISKAAVNPASAIYSLIYEGKEGRWSERQKKREFVYPNHGSTDAKIRSMKKYISIRGASVAKFKFVKAGFRENITVEVWLVPYGATPPTPTPTLTKMKYRKGKATGFCLWCCGP